MMVREVPHSSRNQGKYQLSLSVSVRGQEIYLSSPVTGHCTAITAAIHQTVLRPSDTGCLYNKKYTGTFFQNFTRALNSPISQKSADVMSVKLKVYLNLLRSLT